MRTLADFAKTAVRGAVVQVLSIPADRDGERLSRLGFCHGMNVRYLGKSIFGSPIFIEIAGTQFALRLKEAEVIQVDA